MRWSLTASATAALAVAALLLGTAGAGAASPTGYWKLSLKLELTSTGTATNPRCYPDPEQVAPTPVSGTATQRIVWKTLRPTTVEFHEAPNGVPVAGETNYTRGFRGKLTETRAGDVQVGGEPAGCYGGPPKTDCGSRSVVGGIHVNPLGGIHNWKGSGSSLSSLFDPSEQTRHGCRFLRFPFVSWANIHQKEGRKR